MTSVAALTALTQSYRALRPVPQPLDERLATFIDGWQSLSAARLSSGDAATGATVATLARLIAQLGPALNEARVTAASVNIWQIAGLGRDERRNAEALAWLLDPRGSHGLGTKPLQAFFAAVEVGMPAPDAPERAIVRTEHRPMHSERDRVDLIIEHPALLLFLEIKIDAGQGHHQLDRYLEAAKTTAARMGCPEWRLIFLTVRRPPDVPAGVVSLLWRDLASMLRNMTRHASADPHVGRSIDQLLKHFHDL